MTNTKTELKEIAADLNRLIDALQAGATRSVVGRAVDRLAQVILSLSAEPVPDCPKCGVAHYPNCEQQQPEWYTLEGKPLHCATCRCGDEPSVTPCPDAGGYECQLGDKCKC